MSSPARYLPSNKSNPGCARLTTMAERELSAFYQAVTRSFGSEQAARSAEDWLHEFLNIDRLPASVSEWRWITTKASTRLASRVIASSLSTAPQMA